MVYRKAVLLFILIGLISLACMTTSPIPLSGTDTPTVVNTIAVPLLATATPEPTITPTPGPTELLNTDFSAPIAAWDNQVGKDEVVTYQNPGYQIKLSRPNSKAIRLLGVNSQDISLSYQYNMTLSNDQTGNGSFSGVYCRYHDDKNYYALGHFKIAGNNDYSFGIAKMVNGAFKMLIQIPYSITGGVETISNVGKIEKKMVDGQEQSFFSYEARCIGNRLSLYGENMLLLTVTDNAFPNGDAGIGLWTGNLDAFKPFVWDLTSIKAQDLTGVAQDGLEWKLAQGEEYVIYNEDFSNPAQTRLCDNPNTVKDNYKGLVKICEDGGMKVYLHKTKDSYPSTNFQAYVYYPATENMDIEFDASLINGNNQIGLVVGGGFPNNGSTIYTMYMEKGAFDVEKCAQGYCKVVFGNKRLGVNPVIKPLADGNHFMIKVIKGNLYFYINNSLQAQLSNEKIPFTNFGLLTFYDNVVVYKNLVVKIPSQSEMAQTQ